MVAGYMREMEHEEEGKAFAECEWDLDCLEKIGDEPSSLAVQQKKPAYMVRIGQEIALNGMEDMSFITTTYRIGQQITGQIGVIGPKRMQYGNIISQISFVNRALSDVAKDHYGRGECPAPDDGNRKRRD